MNKDTTKVFSLFAHKHEWYDSRDGEGGTSEFVANVNLSEDQLVDIMVKNDRFNSFDDLIIICNGHVIYGSPTYGCIDNTTEQENYGNYLREYYHLIIYTKICNLIEERRKKVEKEKQELLQRKLQQVKEEQEKISKKVEQDELRLFLSLKKKYERS